MRLIKSQWGSGLLGVLTIAALLSTLLPLHARAQRVDAERVSTQPTEVKAPVRTQNRGQILAAGEPNTEPGTPAGFEVDGTQVCGDASSLGFGIPDGDDWGQNGGCVGEADPADGIDTVQFTDCNWGSQGDRGDATQFGSAGEDDGSNTNFDLIGCDPGQHPWEWNGIGGNPQKDDITNVYVHRRSACRDSGAACDPEIAGDCGAGDECHNWLFLGLETRATNGDRHADFEINQAGLFIIPKGAACDPANGTQASCSNGEACCDDSTQQGRIIGAGPIGGRSIGDLLFTFDYERGGEHPILEVRKWTAGATYEDVTGIVQGVNAFGEVNQADESNANFPWVGFDTHGRTTDFVERLQFVEVGIDQTDLDIDFPDACLPNATVMAKTRSSQSVSAELKDWALHQFPVVPPPACEAEGDEVCEGFNALLRARGAGGKPPYTITWRDGSDTVVHTCTDVAEGAWCELSFTPATPADAGTYSATVADRRGCVDMPCPVDLIVNPLPTTNVSGAEACIDAADPTVHANEGGGTGAITCAWSGAGASCLDDTSSCDPVFDLSLCGAGTHALDVTVTDEKGCEASSSTSVRVNPLPTTNASGAEACIDAADPTIHANEGGGTGAITCAWSGAGASCLDDTSSCDPVFDLSLCGAGTHALDVTVTDSKGCQASSSTSVIVNPLPTTNASGAEACIDAADPTVHANEGGGTGAITCSWSGAGASCLDNANSCDPVFDLSLCGAGTHALDVTVTDEKGCQASSSTSVRVNPLPTTNASGAEECIDAADPTVHANEGAGTGAITCAWSGAGASCLDDTSSCDPVFDLDLCSAGTHALDVTVTDSKGCQASSSTSVRVNPLPTTNATGGEECIDGTDPTVHANEGDGTGSLTCSWSGAGASCLDDTSSCDPVFDLSLCGAGTHALDVTVTDEKGCEASSSTSVRVNPLPTTNASGAEECIDAADPTVHANEGGGTGAITCAWSGAGASCLDDTSSCDPVFDLSLCGAGTHALDVTVTDSKSCQASSSTSVRVNPLPTTNATGGEECIDGTDPTVHANEGNGTGAITCSWSGAGASCLFSTNTCDPVFDLDFCGMGTHALDVTVTDEKGCEASSSTSVIVNPLPTCDLTSAAITAQGVVTGGTVSGGAAPYTCTASFTNGWVDTGCSIDAGGNITVNFQTPVPTGSTQLTVDITDASGCMGQCSLNLLITGGCTVDPVNSVCPDEPQTLVAVVDSGLAGQTIEWFGPFVDADDGAVDGTVDCTLVTLGTALKTCSPLDVGETCELMVSESVAGTHSWCAKTTEPNGIVTFCRGDLVVDPNPVADAGDDISDCFDDFTVDPAVGGSPTASGGTPAYTYAWTGDRTDCLSSTTVANPTFNVNCAPSGDYDLCVRVTDSNGCWDEDCMVLTIYPEPTCTVDPPTAEICSTETQQFCAVPDGGTPGYTYLWSTGSTDACITVSDAGTYTVTVTDSNGCEHECQGELTVVPCGQACSPGFWRNNLEEWCLTPFIPFDGHCGGSATLFKDAFELTSCPGDPGDTSLSGNFNTLTLHSAVDSSGGNNQTLFHCSAALLSSTIMAFPLETSQVVDAVQDACSGAISWGAAFQICRDANAVEYDPNGCCPFSSPDCPLPSGVTLDSRSEPVRTLDEKSSGR